MLKKQARELFSGRWAVGQVSLRKQHLSGKWVAFAPRGYKQEKAGHDLQKQDAGQFGWIAG